MEKVKSDIEQTFGYKDFKSPDQEYAVKNVLHLINLTKNIILSMATQAGKSLVYQLLGVVKDKGVTVVISPSIALINDQLQFLENNRVGASAIISSTPYDERDEIFDELCDDEGGIKFLFLTPEMIECNESAQHFLTNGNINYVVVDEAHRVIDTSAFRPAFQILKELRNDLLETPWIALTTADEDICKQIGASLGMENAHLIGTTSIRKNIVYDVKWMNELNDIGKYIKSLALPCDGEIPSGVIFCRKINMIHSVGNVLEKNNIGCDKYYANRGDDAQKADILSNWAKKKFPVLVATSESFGFGINYNVPSIRFVIHIGSPKSVRHFYQESGRAGNDGEKGYSRIYLSSDDVSGELVSYISASCRRQALASHFGEVTEKCLNMCDKCIQN